MRDKNSGIEIPPELQAAEFTLNDVTGIGRHLDDVLLDASNIMKIGDRFYVWYTRLPYNPDWMASWHTVNCTKIWLATSEDGWNWDEYGQVLEDSADDAWHAKGKHAPDVVFHDGKYCMYFTAHSGTPRHEKHIGVAIADKPEGPFRHVNGEPVLSPALDTRAFDALLVDDPCCIIREGLFWLYYKGRTSMDRDSPLMIGLAVGENATGPFTRWVGNPLVCGHTGCVWPHREGVALIGDARPPNRALYYSRDGRHFKKTVDIDAAVSDPGVFCPETFDDGSYGRGVQWGLSQLYEVRERSTDQSGIAVASSYIVRWDCDMRAPEK
jgi:hypothetical protein